MSEKIMENGIIIDGKTREFLRINDDGHRYIVKIARMGWSSEEIAQTLKIPLGVVEDIVNPYSEKLSSRDSIVKLVNLAGVSITDFIIVISVSRQTRATTELC